ncbi:MAG: VanZ family protein, partial [Oscillospiraceae bacterium]
MSTFRAKLFAILSTAWGIFIFSNSLKTGTQSSAVSDSIVDKLVLKLGLSIDVDLLTLLIRKAAHLSEYLLLGLLISLCCYYTKKRFQYNILTILFLGLSASVLDEFLQTFIVGRSGEVRDILIDFAGILIGFFIVYFV